MTHRANMSTRPPIMKANSTCNAWAKDHYCQAKAGLNTNHEGKGRCRTHGGAGGRHKDVHLLYSKATAEEIEIEKYERYFKKPQQAYTALKTEAKKRDTNFELSFADFLCFWDKPCFYCGDALKGSHLDRVDNDKKIGYTKENAVPCCIMCNRMKLNHTVSDFVNQCEKVVKKQLITKYNEIKRLRRLMKPLRLTPKEP